jgi:hypothetical protein
VRRLAGAGGIVDRSRRRTARCAACGVTGNVTDADGEDQWRERGQQQSMHTHGTTPRRRDVHLLCVSSNAHASECGAGNAECSASSPRRGCIAQRPAAVSRVGDEGMTVRGDIPIRPRTSPRKSTAP